MEETKKTPLIARGERLEWNFYNTACPRVERISIIMPILRRKGDIGVSVSVAAALSKVFKR